MKNKLIVVVLLLLMILSEDVLNGAVVTVKTEAPVASTHNVSDDESGKDMPTIVTQTFDDIATDPQDFIKEDEDVIEEKDDSLGADGETDVEEDDEDKEDKYEDEFDAEPPKPVTLDPAPDGRRRSIKQVTWYERIFDNSRGFLTRFRV